jgi:hypothetical protein
MKFKPKVSNGANGKATIIESLTLTASNVDEICLLASMVRVLMIGGKIRAEPSGFPTTWVRCEGVENQGK